VLVVDTNVVAYLLVEGDRTAQAREMWGLDSDWVAPRLLAYELMNVFAMLVRQRALSPEVAMAGLESGLSLVRLMDRGPAEPARILVIAEKLRLSAYDATYLAMAETMQVPLVTEDARLLRAAPEVARSLASYCPAAPLY
jgi:predicted nucleic acid-binding protein